jgi:ATP adenylyltransferase
MNTRPFLSPVVTGPCSTTSGSAIAAEATAIELMLLARTAEARLREVYRPEGLNIGINIGKSAGAGVAGHVHLHALPRWHGDVNFMTAVGETRVLPEDLDATWKRLRNAFCA